MLSSSDLEATKWGFKAKCIFALIVLYFVYGFFYFDKTIIRNVDMEPFSIPIQEPLNEKLAFQQNFSGGGIAYIVPLAKYKIYGRVLEKHYVPKKLYLASIVPYDVTLVWGRASKKEFFKLIKTTMSGRVVYFDVKDNPNFSIDDAADELSNNHLIPANNKVRQGIRKLKKSDVVYMNGYLVKVSIHKPDGKVEKSQSSLTRNDTGLGACEMIYVTELYSKHGIFK